MRAPARARIPVTVGSRNLLVALRAALASWWLWVDRPDSLADTWRASAVDPSRIPNNSSLLATVWRWANRTERCAFFALTLLAPTALTGPLRWAVQRPTRRVVAYILIGALAALLFG